MEDPLREAEQALSDGDFAAADRLARGVLQAGTSYEALVLSAASCLLDEAFLVTYGVFNA